MTNPVPFTSEKQLPLPEKTRVVFRYLEVRILYVTFGRNTSNPRDHPVLDLSGNLRLTTSGGRSTTSFELLPRSETCLYVLLTHKFRTTKLKKIERHLTLYLFSFRTPGRVKYLGIEVWRVKGWVVGTHRILNIAHRVLRF